ncbi:MAG TPA: hypothetical protein VHB50_12055 [Bryobacteraceae bacterium]|nr:hypothetical protein [Bryobacteraceae bacterium]
MRLRKLLTIFVPAAVAIAGLSSSYMFPVDSDAIQYSRGQVDDSVSRLETRLEKGDVKLQYDDEFGYLKSVLKELHVPASSQVLVFSKTSFQAPRIAPRTPRALYFNDDVAVGFVRTGDVLEFAALDPKQGIIFYTLDQERASHPHFIRRDTCLQCHQSGGTLGIPGLMVRSVTPDRSGMPVMSAGGFVTDHRSPLSERWGGWYVTGTTGRQQHMGNTFLQDANGDQKLAVSDDTINVTDLSRFIDTAAWLTPHSDVVALMTLEHQTQMDNLMIRVGWEARTALLENEAINKSLGEPVTQVRESIQHRINTAVEDLVEYMLFADEAKLTSPVKGTSGFAAEFQARGPKDPKGRSLRDFDLKTRMFRYPCSFMIYSETFDSLPEIVKTRVYERLRQVLTGQDASPKYAHLTAEDRRAIFEILTATKKDFASASEPAPARASLQ